MGKIKGFFAVLIFFAILASPFIYNAFTNSQEFDHEKLEKPDKSLGKYCLVIAGAREKDKSAEANEDFIIANHGDILSHAGIIPGRAKSVRDMAVRQGKRSEGGLNGCIACHQNRAKFCDQCHDYVGVQTVNEQTGCFACHNYPTDKYEGGKQVRYATKEWDKWNEAMKKWRKKP